MATYGKLRETRILGQAGTTWYVQLWKKDYTGDPISMDLEGEGFTCKYTGSGGTRDRRFINSECVLNFIVQNDTDEALLYDILEKGDREYYIRVYKNSISRDNIWWFGWVHPSFSTFQNTPYPYGSSIIATDSVGTYSKQAESAIPSAEFSSSFTINEHIKDFGDDAGLYNVETDEVENGSFLVDTTGWSFGSRWSLDSGLGKINFTGSTANYLNSSSGGISVTSGDNISISFTIQDLGENESFSLSFRNQGLQFLLGTSQSTYQFYSNGNYVIKGTSLVSAIQLRINPTPISGSINFSLTDISLVKTLVTDSAPCPTSNNWFRNSIDWYKSGDASQYNVADPFFLYKTAKSPFRKDQEKFPSKYLKYDVLDGSLKVFNTVCMLSNGAYNFVQPNKYQSNSNGQLPFWSYKEGGLENAGTPNIIDNLITLDGSISANKGAVMAGSSIVYEPPFKNVSATFLNGAATIEIPPNVDVSNYTNIGNVQQDSSNTTGYLQVLLNFEHKELLDAQEVASDLSTDYNLANHRIRTKWVWQIKLTDGVNNYYLTRSGNVFIWQQTTEPDNDDLGCGYLVGSNPNTGQAFPSNDGPTSTTPCRVTYNPGDANYEVYSNLSYGPIAPLPPITGAVFIKLTAINEYKEWKEGPTWAGTNGNWITIPEADITRETYFRVNSKITDVASIAINEQQEGIKYFATNNDIIAEELFDFDDIIIGNTGNINNTSNNLQTQFNVQYTNASGFDLSAIQGFRARNSGGYSNITQLLCNEFLSIQKEPLEILQADVFSPDISPSSFLRYDINNNLSPDYKYYTFLGGTYKAQSETMSGEWFKINEYTPSTETEEQINPVFSQISVIDENTNLINILNLINLQVSNENSLGKINFDIPSGVSLNKLDLSSSTTGKVYKNQKLILRHPTSYETLVLTVSGEQNKGSSSINVNAITPITGFPKNSTISALKSDLTNVKAENVLDVRTAHYHHSSALSTYYIPISGATTAEGSLSSSAYHLMFTAPYNGFVKSIHNYNSHNSSKFSFITFHKAGSTTATGDTITTPTYTNNFEVDCPSNWTFTKGDIISFGRADSSQVHGVSMSIVLQYNTQPPAQPQP